MQTYVIIEYVAELIFNVICNWADFWAYILSLINGCLLIIFKKLKDEAADVNN